YTDADHAGCQDTRRSTSGSAQFLGDKLVSWSSKKKKCTAISSTEAKYIALSGCSLKLSPCYPAFQITAEVPEIYIHQFWNTIKKIGKTYAYDFKMEKKKCRVDTECDMLSTIQTDQMHQPWRTFAAVIGTDI
ncbi:retrovirus-related pol polyprotein from transposon TNT 1-94, partial [Tanacetum coccineum]